jgi:hypothetical protein
MAPPPMARNQFRNVEQCASDESVRHSCRNNAYFEGFVHSLLKLQYLFDFSSEFDLFSTTLQDNTGVELEVSFHGVFSRVGFSCTLVFFNDFNV